MKEGNNKILKQLANNLLHDYLVYAPIKHDNKLLVTPAKTAKDIDWSGQLTDNPWKEMFTPYREKLFDLKNGQISAINNRQPATICLGMTILDLKALTLYDVVFSNDIAYQNRRKKIAVIGFSADWPNDYKNFKVFSHNFEDKILAHVAFDIFIAKLKGDKLKFYSGSDKGRTMLEKYGINEFDHIEFEGAKFDSGPDKRMTGIANKVAKSYNHSLWNMLDEICLACGKCSIACPTCFCFNLEDKCDPSDARRDRVRGNCFFNDFSKVAGGHKELASAKDKLYFWYTHKFVRIPQEHQIPGCVSCGRCVKACPVGIDIFKNIAKLEKIKLK